MKVRRGPAAVTRDERHVKNHCPKGWEGVANRMIWKPEDLSDRGNDDAPVEREMKIKKHRVENGIPEQ